MSGPFHFDGHALTLTDGVLSCATHKDTCDVDKYTLTPLQRATLAACLDDAAKPRLVYTYLVENRVRALAKAKGVPIPDDFAVKLSITDPRTN